MLLCGYALNLNDLYLKESYKEGNFMRSIMWDLKGNLYYKFKHSFNFKYSVIFICCLKCTVKILKMIEVNIFQVYEVNIF